jgi:hypothetical protein
MAGAFLVIQLIVGWPENNDNPKIDKQTQQLIHEYGFRDEIAE